MKLEQLKPSLMIISTEIFFIPCFNWFIVQTNVIKHSCCCSELPKRNSVEKSDRVNTKKSSYKNFVALYAKFRTTNCAKSEEAKLIN